MVHILFIIVNWSFSLEYYEDAPQTHDSLFLQAYFHDT